MTIDKALEIVMRELNGILIPASESAKMESVKGGIRDVITAVQNQLAQEAQQAQAKKEAQEHED